MYIFRLTLHSKHSHSTVLFHDMTPLVLAVSCPLLDRIRTFHPLATCPAKRTQKAPQETPLKRNSGAALKKILPSEQDELFIISHIHPEGSIYFLIILHLPLHFLLLCLQQLPLLLHPLSLLLPQKELPHRHIFH